MKFYKLLILTLFVSYSLEENWIENVAGIKEIDDAQWKQLNIPMGLVNQIKKVLQDEDKPSQSEEMQIDSKQEKP